MTPTPTTAPKRSRSSRPPIQYLDHPTVLRLLAAAGRASVRDHAMFTTAFWHGLRASEVGLLRLEDWRPQSATVGRLFVRRLKGSVSAEYPVSPETARALRAWLTVRGDTPGALFVTRKGGPPTRQTLDRLMKRYCEALRPPVPPDLRHFHVLRHSVAVRMVNRRLPLQEIRDWLGHKSTRSTEWYLAQVSPVRDRTGADLWAEGTEENRQGQPKNKPAPTARPNWGKDRGGR